jgi:hypothetical protein
VEEGVEGLADFLVDVCVAHTDTGHPGVCGEGVHERCWYVGGQGCEAALTGLSLSLGPT